MPTTRTGPSQPPIPNTTSPRLQNIYLRQRAVLISSKAEVGVPDRRMRRKRAQTAAWNGAWQCLRLPKITAPLSALSSLPSHARPAQHSSFSKVDFLSVEQKTSASARSSTTLPSLQLRCAAETSGVFPSWD